MSFADGEIAFGRSFDPKTGKQILFFCYPNNVTFEEAKRQVAPDLDLEGWREEERTSLHDTFINRLLRGEVREFIRFVKP